MTDRNPSDCLPLTEGRPVAHGVDAALRLMWRYAHSLDQPLYCVEVSTGRILGRTNPDLLCPLPREVLDLLQTLDTPRVHVVNSGLIFCAIPQVRDDGERVAFLGYFLSNAELRPVDLIIEAAEQGWSRDRFDRWLAIQKVQHPAPLETQLTTVFQNLGTEGVEGILRHEIDGLASQIAGSYEEISLLHVLTQNLQFSRDTSDLAKLSIQRLQQLDRAEGHAIWFDDCPETNQIFVAGRLPIERSQLSQLVAAVQEAGHECSLVHNTFENTEKACEFPGLRNFILVPITEGPRRVGWLFVCNSTSEPQFHSLETSLLNSVAALISTHSYNQRLFREHDELLLSFVRAMVSSLDAKDPYTRGHSERVALIAQHLGAHLELPAEQIRNLYLAGLLHDIGKIGIDDRILQKAGELTEDELRTVQEHPVVGASILGSLSNLSETIPGIRNHHENYSGGGYPDGLVREQIPLIARILSVADAFDAMRSDRPYRAGMPLQRIEDVLQNGSGTQWDPAVITAYFEIREQIHRVASVYQSDMSGQHDSEEAFAGLVAAVQLDVRD